jgi:type I restriction-modification system DNA methylase subunit/transcriptional regulator with XRE-family HTH domain
MKSISEMIHELTTLYHYSIESLGSELGVSTSAINRWKNKKSKPRPLIEGELRKIYKRSTSSALLAREPDIQWPLFRQEIDIRKAMDATLRELREILHRRGRMSSRNEAVEELSKLLFVHVMAIGKGSVGISRKSIRENFPGMSIAKALKTFVKESYEAYLPLSIGHELQETDYELKIKESEEDLILEIIQCFETLASESESFDISGIKGVDFLNDVFGRFLSDSFVDEKQLGQYLTPTEVVSFMVKLAIQEMSENELRILTHPEQCREFGFILDPSCGVGSFLTEILRFLHHEVISKNDERMARQWLSNMVHDVLVGIDKSERMIKLALTNMAMFTLPATRLFLANALVRFGDDAKKLAFLEGQTGLILTNPPFGAEFKGDDLGGFKIANKWSNHIPHKLDSELLFVERYLDWLIPGGQLLAIVPDSILTNKGLYETLRKNIADQVEIKSVISLPNVTFGAAGTNTKTSILHFRKRSKRSKKKSITTPTFFAICKNIGYSVSTRESQRKKVFSGEGDLPRILEERTKQTQKNGYGRFVKVVEKKERWDANYHATLPPEIEEIIVNRSNSHVFLSDVSELSAERSDPRRWGDGTFLYIEISDVNTETCKATGKRLKCSEAPSRARKIVRTGDILFSTVRPERRTVARVTEEQEGAICTTGFAVLRPKDIDSLVLAQILRTDFVCQQVLRNNIGIAYPAIDESCLLDLLLPITKKDLKNLATQAQIIIQAESELEALRTEFQDKIQRRIAMWKEKIA